MPYLLGLQRKERTYFPQPQDWSVNLSFLFFFSAGNDAFFKKFIYFILFILFLAALGLHCCAQAFLWLRQAGTTLCCCAWGLLIAVASLVVEHGLLGVGVSVVVAHGLSSCGSRA